MAATASFSTHAMTLAIVVAAGQLIALCSAGSAYLYDSSSLTDTGDFYDHFKRIKIHETQRCYSFPCVSSQVTSLRWEGTPTSSKMVLFENERCTGYQLEFTGKYGDIQAKNYGLNNSIASLFVWESSTYAIRGYVDKCEDERAPLLANASTVGEI